METFRHRLASLAGWALLCAVAGLAVALHGMDVAVAGYNALVSGAPQATMTVQGLEAAGVPPDWAEGIDDGISIAGSMGAGAASTTARAGAVAPGTIKGSVSPATPVGRLKAPLSVQPGSNQPTVINGRTYTGHALDRMQERGLTPTVVESAIEQATPVPSRNATIMYSKNGIKVIVNENGDVVTAMPQ